MTKLIIDERLPERLKRKCGPEWMLDVPSRLRFHSAVPDDLASALIITRAFQPCSQIAFEKMSINGSLNRRKPRVVSV